MPARPNPRGTPQATHTCTIECNSGSHELVLKEATMVAEDARAALGADAVNEAKTIISNRLDMIGGRCNAVTFTVSPIPRACMCLNSFMCLRS